MIDKSKEYRENKAVKDLMKKLIAAENEALSPDDSAEKKRTAEMRFFCNTIYFH